MDAASFDQVAALVRGAVGELSEPDEVELEDDRVISILQSFVLEDDEDDDGFVLMPTTVLRVVGTGEELLFEILPSIVGSFAVFCDGSAMGRRYLVSDAVVLYHVTLLSQDARDAADIMIAVKQLPNNESAVLFASLDKEGNGPRELFLEVAKVAEWPTRDGELVESILGLG